MAVLLAPPAIASLELSSFWVWSWAGEEGDGHHYYSALTASGTIVNIEEKKQPHVIQDTRIHVGEKQLNHGKARPSGEAFALEQGGKGGWSSSKAQIGPECAKSRKSA